MKSLDGVFQEAAIPLSRQQCVSYNTAFGGADFLNFLWSDSEVILYNIYKACDLAVLISIHIKKNTKNKNKKTMKSAVQISAPGMREEW